MAERNIPNHIQQKMKENAYIRVPEVTKKRKLKFYSLYDDTTQTGFNTEDKFVSTVMNTTGTTGITLRPIKSDLLGFYEIDAQAIGTRQLYNQDAQNFSTWFYDKSAPRFKIDKNLTIDNRLFIVTIDEDFDIDEEGNPTTPLYVLEANDIQDINGEYFANELTLKKIRPYISKKIDGEFVFFIWTKNLIQPVNWKWLNFKTDGFAHKTKQEIVDNNSQVIIPKRTAQGPKGEVIKNKGVEHPITWRTQGNQITFYSLWYNYLSYIRNCFNVFSYSSGSSQNISYNARNTDGQIVSPPSVNRGIPKNTSGDNGPSYFYKYGSGATGFAGDIGDKPFHAMRNIYVGTTQGGFNFGGYENSMLAQAPSNPFGIGLTNFYPTTNASGTFPRNRAGEAWYITNDPAYLIDITSTFSTIGFVGNYIAFLGTLLLNDRERKLTDFNTGQSGYIGTDKQLDNFSNFMTGNYINWNGNTEWVGFPDIFDESNNPNIQESVYDTPNSETSKGFGISTADRMDQLAPLINLGSSNTITQEYQGQTGERHRISYSNPLPFKQQTFKDGVFTTENPDFAADWWYEADTIQQATNQITLVIRGGFRITYDFRDENGDVITYVDQDTGETKILEPLVFKAPNLQGNPRKNEISIVFGARKKKDNHIWDEIDGKPTLATKLGIKVDKKHNKLKGFMKNIGMKK